MAVLEATKFNPVQLMSLISENLYS